MVQHSFCYSQIVVCCVDRLKPQPNCELNTQEIRQQIGSAFRSAPEQKVSRVITSEIDPKQPFEC